MYVCLLYTSDAADERSSVDLGGRRIIKKKKKKKGEKIKKTKEKDRMSKNATEVRVHKQRVKTPPKTTRENKKEMSDTDP